jgi:rhodanese-related sulfurtransferase
MRGFLAAGLLALALAGCGGDAEPARLTAALQAVTRGEDVVSPARLSEWLQQGVALVDIRPAAAYEQGHIQGAVRSEPGDLLGRPSGGRQVIYAQDSEPAAQLVTLLRLQGREAYLLAGGYRAWQAHLDPGDAATASEEELARRRALACQSSAAYPRAAGFTPAGGGYVPAVQPLSEPAAPFSAEPPAAPMAEPPPLPREGC